MDGQGQRGDMVSQSGLSNSTESLDSMKALTAAIEAANAQIHGPASQHMGNGAVPAASAAAAPEDRKKDFKKNRCLSIGIQVRLHACGRGPQRGLEAGVSLRKITLLLTLHTP